MTSAVPVVTDIAYQDLLDDPYPIFRRLREIAPAVFVAPAKLTLVTRFDDIMRIERDPATYSADNPASLVNKVMGPTFMRKDGAEHAIGRKAIEPSFRPATIKEHWAPQFTAIAERLIDDLSASDEADLFSALAAPMASLSLMAMIGFRRMPWQTLADWSQALIDGAGNYAADAEVERKAMQASADVDAAIDAVLDDHRSHLNPSILSSMVNADPPMPIEGIRANIKVIIGGGLNEPRDAILTLVLGLLENPAQKDGVLAKPELWPAALEEAVRWISPIGMYPRRVTRDVDLSGITLPQDLQIGPLRRRREPRRQPLRRARPLRRDAAQAIASGIRRRTAFLRRHLGVTAHRRQDRGADAVRALAQSAPPRGGAAGRARLGVPRSGDAAGAMGRLRTRIAAF
ncbi:cytochrome P450 [Bradyrhizobium elkanii]